MKALRVILLISVLMFPVGVMASGFMHEIMEDQAYVLDYYWITEEYTC